MWAAQAAVRCNPNERLRYVHGHASTQGHRQGRDGAQHDDSLVAGCGGMGAWFLPSAWEPSTCAHLDSHSLKMFVSLTERSPDRSGRAATRQPARFNHYDCTIPTFFRCPQFARLRACLGEEVARDETTQRRFRATADVPILWTHHPASQTILSGMWKISKASLEVHAERGTKMPFSGNCHSFDSSTLECPQRARHHGRNRVAEESTIQRKTPYRTLLLP